MSDTAKHTPFPWYVEQASGFIGSLLPTFNIVRPESAGRSRAIALYIEKKEDADFIVRACNEHDDLVAAVYNLHALCLRLGIDKRTDINLAPITNAQIAFINATTSEQRAAIAKAGAA